MSNNIDELLVKNHYTYSKKKTTRKKFIENVDRFISNARNVIGNARNVIGNAPNVIGNAPNVISSAVRSNFEKTHTAFKPRNKIKKKTGK